MECRDVSRSSSPLPILRLTGTAGFRPQETSLMCVVFEQRPQLPPAAMEARHHGPDRSAHDLRDLLVRETLDIGEVDGDTELLGKRGERVLHVAVRQV